MNSASSSSESVWWDLQALRAEWTQRRAAVLAAKATIDPTGMTRPPRDPVEWAWLEAHGLTGPFREVVLPRR
ncbi:MAG TPA: hypothetical protein VNU46_08385 [Gemmatimonadaceae bacterium]|jgi:hypothetical protein|nr:hypothetical protein [Gemmatimonadaceae bacterium]